MAYIVRIQTGSGKNRNVSQSIPLPNKKRVRRWVDRNPVGNITTKVTIRNTRTNKTISKTKAGASLFGYKLPRMK